MHKQSLFSYHSPSVQWQLHIWNSPPGRGVFWRSVWCVLSAVWQLRFLYESDVTVESQWNVHVIFWICKFRFTAWNKNIINLFCRCEFTNLVEILWKIVKQKTFFKVFQIEVCLCLYNMDRQSTCRQLTTTFWRELWRLFFWPSCITPNKTKAVPSTSSPNRYLKPQVSCK